MTWREVREHLRKGAKLVYTNDIPGGWSFAIRHDPEGLPRRAKLIQVERLPDWVGVPSPWDHRPILAALEMSISAELD